MDLKVNYTLPLSLLVEDKFGNQSGSLDLAPVWSVDAAFGSLVVAADGLSAQFIPNGKLGLIQVQVAAQVNGLAVSASMDLNLLAGDAVKIEIVAGAPVLQ